MTNSEQRPRPEDHVRTTSRPSDLRITDMRTATVGWENWHFTIIRIDTNQGISGYGEVRDFASKTYALQLKRLLLGENPCNVERLFRKIKQFGGHGRQGGGVSGVEMALMDLAGKAYNVPAYVLAGGKYRDRIRMYCDTPNEDSGEAMGYKLKGRLEQGFTMLKMDLGVQPLYGVPGALSWPQGMLPSDSVDKMEKMFNATVLMHPFTHVRLTPKGIRMICEYVEQVRAIVGDEVPIAADHFGHIGIDDCLRLGEALEPYNLAWLEDLVPWQYTDSWVQLERALNTPVCTGEDIYCLDGFKALLDARAVNVIHPDLATSGGILETKRIGDYAQQCGVSMALHMLVRQLAPLPVSIVQQLPRTSLPWSTTSPRFPSGGILSTVWRSPSSRMATSMFLRPQGWASRSTKRRSRSIWWRGIGASSSQQRSGMVCGVGTDSGRELRSR